MGEKAMRQNEAAEIGLHLAGGIGIFPLITCAKKAKKTGAFRRMRVRHSVNFGLLALSMFPLQRADSQSITSNTVPAAIADAGTQQVKERA